MAPDAAARRSPATSRGPVAAPPARPPLPHRRRCRHAPAQPAPERRSRRRCLQHPWRAGARADAWSVRSLQRVSPTCSRRARARDRHRDRVRSTTIRRRARPGEAAAAPRGRRRAGCGRARSRPSANMSPMRRLRPTSPRGTSADSRRAVAIACHPSQRQAVVHADARHGHKAAAASRRAAGKPARGRCHESEPAPGHELAALRARASARCRPLVASRDGLSTRSAARRSAAADAARAASDSTRAIAPEPRGVVASEL